jgi:pyridinium-3,5-bisthiocarboxylic acid mononucleotide nickel chelatase
MRLAYLDCFSGISGDMFLGALVDAGVPAQLLEETVAALGLGATLEISRVIRNGIAATKVDVYANGEKDLPREVFWEQQVHDSDPPTHSHHGHSRGLAEIRRIISDASISATAKTTAIRMFETLGAAEAEIHNCAMDQVHFHEVGAVDALVDIVCTAVGAESLAIDQWICSPLNVGGGTVKCAHGTLPVPAPATLKLLKDAPVYSSGPQVELVTPTGAAIVKTLAARFASFPSMKIAASGYGAGSRDFADHPNVLRITIGKAIQQPARAPSAKSLAASDTPQSSDDFSTDTVTILEANLDDLSPQILAYAMDRLLAEGALDAFSVPVQMKKNRAGALLTVLAKPEDADRLTRIIFGETTTLGVRRRDELRRILSRRWETVQTEWGPVRIKIANLNGTVSNYAPEFEDCRRIAADHHVPLKKVMEEAIRKFAAGTSNSQ